MRAPARNIGRMEDLLIVAAVFATFLAIALKGAF